MRAIKPRKMVLDENQIPMMTPDSDWQCPKTLPDITSVGEIGLDIETLDGGLQNGQGPGWAFRNGKIAGVGVAWRSGADIQRIYVPICHPDTANFPKDNVARWVTDITKTNRVVFFNAGYDIGWLNADMGVPIPKIIDDASCAAFLIDENRADLSLDGCCEWRGVPGKNVNALREAATIFGFRAQDAVANIAKLPARYAGPYGEQDPASTLELMENLRHELTLQGLTRAYNIEMRLIPIIHAMRQRGIRIDLDRAEKFKKAMENRSDKAIQALSEKLKVPVSMKEIRSHKWLEHMHGVEGVVIPTYRNDAASFERDWMRRATHWLPRLVAEAKQCRDMADKFIGTFLLDFSNNGRIHASINQWLYEQGGTRSHRLSYSNPPLQQAPSRGEAFEGWPLTGEMAIEYRRCFLPEEGTQWFSPDYSQQEYRLIVSDAERLGLPRADVAGDMYRNDPKTDFHNLVVSLTGLPRHQAKNCNFAKSYGAGVAKFADMTGKTVEEAADIMGTYDREMPFVKMLGFECERLAQSRGYIKLFDGARCHFEAWEPANHRHDGLRACSKQEAELRKSTLGHPWYRSRLKRALTHKAMNRRIQGNAARQMKLAMVTCGEAGHLPMLQMHDELSFSLDNKATGKWIADTMATVYTCNVPFLVDAEWGPNWGDAKGEFKAKAKDTHIRERRSGDHKRGNLSRQKGR